MSAWIALLDEPSGDLWARAGDAVLAGWLDADRRPHPQARRADPRVLDPHGEAGVVSLLWPDVERLPLFDDPAVVQARRRARAGQLPRCATTFTVDSRHWAGSLWAPRAGVDPRDDPFRPLGRPAVLHVAAGLLSRSVALAGPAQERYAGAPWPAGSFPARQGPGPPGLRTAATSGGDA